MRQHRLSKSLFSVAAAAASFALPIHAQSTDFAGQAPSIVRPLQTSMRVSVAGSGAFASLETPRVWVDGRERTSVAGVELLSSGAFDFDADGRVDETRAEYVVRLDALNLTVGQLVEVDVGAETAGGPRHYRTASRVEPNVELRVSDSVSFGAEPVQVYVEWHELALTESALIVTVDGRDVTRWIGLESPTVILDDQTNGFLVSRIEHYELDMSRLAGRGLDGMPLTVSMYGATASGRAAWTSVTTFGTTAGWAKVDDPCQAAAIEKFCKDMAFTKTNGSVSSPKSAAEKKKAADDLQQALAICETPFGSSVQTHKCGDLTIKIKVGQTTANVSISEKADVVVAIGGDGSGSQDGANATATNTQAGGAAVAVGGDGGSGVNSAGDGGNGTATGTCGPGGTPAGSAFGAGGNGGDCSNGTSTGGNGGNGNASTAPPSTTAGAGGSGGTAGNGGGGGWGNTQNNSGSSGHF